MGTISSFNMLAISSTDERSNCFASKDGLFKWYGTDAWTGYPAEVAKYVNNPTYPFWFTTGRSQHVWQTMYNDKRIPAKLLTLPLPYLEIHPTDAGKPPVSHSLPHTDLEQKSGKLLVLNSLRAVLPLFTLVPIARWKEWFWPRSCAHFGERNSHPAGKIYNALSVTGLAGEFNCLLKFANPKGD